MSLTILLSVFSPTQGHTLNAIAMDLENIYGKPHYLHKEDGIYLFKHEINIFALLEKEKKKITEEDIKKKIAEIAKKDVFENRVFIHGFEEIPDDSKTKIVVTLESWGSNDTLKSKLIGVAHGYFVVDLEIVWKIIKEQIPPLKERLKTILEEI